MQLLPVFPGCIVVLPGVGDGLLIHIISPEIGKCVLDILHISGNRGKVIQTVTVNRNPLRYF